MSGAEAPRAERVYLSLVSEHQTAILNYLYRLVGDADAAEDLTQETYVKAWRALERLELDDGAAARRRAWLYRIAHNTALDHLRRKTRFRWLGLDALRGGGGDPAGQVVEGAPVRQALRKLSADHRRVLLLFNQEGLSSEEVAQVLGISPAAARKRRQRARDAFREIYEELGPDGQRQHKELETDGEDEDSDGDGDGGGDGQGGARPDGDGSPDGSGHRGGASVSCSRLQDRLDLGPLSAMAAEERAELEAHAAGCADCLRLLASETWIDSAFDAERRLAPSRALQRSLLELPRRDRRARWLAPLALPLAMAFCALGSWGIWILTPDSGERAESAGTATAAVLGSADATGTAAAALEIDAGNAMTRRRETVEAVGTATAGALSELPPATASVVAATLVAEALARPVTSGTPAATQLAIAPGATRPPRGSGSGEDPDPRQPAPGRTPEVVPPGGGSATEEPTPPSGATQSLVPEPTATPTLDPAEDPAPPTETLQATPTEDPGGGRIATGTVRPPTPTETPDPALPPPSPSRTAAAPTPMPTSAPIRPSMTPGMPPPTGTLPPASPTAMPAPTEEPTAIATASATSTITPTLTATPTSALQQGRKGHTAGPGWSGGPSRPPRHHAHAAVLPEAQESGSASRRSIEASATPPTRPKRTGQWRTRPQSRPGRPAPGRA